MAIGATTALTDDVNSVTNNYIHDSLPDRVYLAANTTLSEMFKRCKKIFHGSDNSYYPHVDTKLNATYTAAQYDGAIAAVAAPVDTDLLGAAHQPGWVYWRLATAIDHVARAENVGSWASKEAVFDLARQKEDALIKAIGEMYNKSIVLGTGAGNNLIGFPGVFDITSTDYLGIDLTVAQHTPKNVTIAVDQTSLTFADMIDLYTEIEEGGQRAQLIIANKDALKRLRIIGEQSVRRSQGGEISIGSSKIDTLGVPIVVDDNVPTTTSTKIYFLDFSAHMDLGNPGGKPKIVPGDYWILEFAGEKPLGFDSTEWHMRQGHEPAMEKVCYGTYKMACNKTSAQGYISIAA